MAAAGDEPWLDDAAGRLVRPYTVSNGRTRPTTALDLLSQVMATGATPLGYFGPEHSQALERCRAPVAMTWERRSSAVVGRVRPLQTV